VKLQKNPPKPIDKAEKSGVAKIGISDKLGGFLEILYFGKRCITSFRYIILKNNELEEKTGLITSGRSAYDLPQESAPNKQDSFKHVSFTFALISLSAAVAKADGGVSREEYLAFRDCFPLSGGICGKIRQLFLLACRSKIPVSVYTTQIKQLFPQQKELFISLVDRLFRIATADSKLSGEESRVIAKIAHLLDLTPAEYSGIYDRYSRPKTPYLVLGVERKSPLAVIKNRYRTLMKRYHPDHYGGNTISPEVKMILTLKSTEINQAYRILSKRAA